MLLKKLKPRESLNKAYLKVKPKRHDFELFKKNLLSVLKTINEKESEEFHKNIISDFLKGTFYSPNYFINTKGRSDLVIHNGKKTKSSVGIILEVKKPSNKAEMIRDNNFNLKAFQEILLYYLRERVVEKNLEIKHLIITNIYEWFIIDAKIFERVFFQNKELIELFKKFESGTLSDKTTDFFFKNIAAPIIDSTSQEILYSYFDIRAYHSILKDEKGTGENRLIALFKLLSPEHLLKLPFINDSNSLDKGFYAELLYIIGLNERKAKGKKIIERNEKNSRHSGSLIENAITQIDSLNKIKYLENPFHFGKTYEERVFNIAIELIITWVNRILFLKLLEAQLISYNKGDKSYSFINIEKVNNFDDLNSLFFQVLAKKPIERNEEVLKIFGNVPYLNSSLFEPSEVESRTIFISNLSSKSSMPILSTTILKDRIGKKRKGNINTLEYLLLFLDAYDFSSESSENIQEENKSLINASVLGLIFEKINGYRDGSFFTPGFVTMYMCRETIRNAIIQKFNEIKKWDCQNIDEIYDKIEINDRAEANEIINEIKICDPAVGSGHFLVSALNEIISIKYDLRILQDRKGKRLKEYQFEVINDELIVTDEDGEFFKYNPNNRLSQEVQEAIFHEKQNIIENCLFGVDINPNSVQICRLRLWIELLKHSYYKKDGSLETLPNIDINIKCGNSLISRYEIFSSLKKELKKNKINIYDYRSAVQSYREATNKDEKWTLEKLILELKNNFRTVIGANDPKQKRLKKLQGELKTLINQRPLFEETKKDKILKEKRKKKLKNNIQKLSDQLNEIENNKIYEESFEWRFEFPEVLNNDGDFIGFDVVIGNPPYGVSIKSQERKCLLETIGKVPDYEIYYWFIDRAYQILRNLGKASYIIPNTLLFNIYAQNYKLSLFERWCIDEILDCTDIEIFSEATVRNIIILVTKNINNNETIGFRETKSVQSFEELIKKPKKFINKDIAEANIQNWGLIFKLPQRILKLTAKIKDNSIALIDIFPETSQGLIAYDKYRGQDDETIKKRAYHSYVKHNSSYKCWLYGEDVSKYVVKWNGKEYFKYCDGVANPRQPKFFKGERILIREITNPSIFAAYTDIELYHDPAVIVILNNPDSKISIYTLLGIFNSKLATFYHFNSSPKATKGAFPKILVYDVNNFPLPKFINKENETKIASLTKKIVNSKKQNPDENTAGIENEINQKVYEIYELTKKEINIVEDIIK